MKHVYFTIIALLSVVATALAVDHFHTVGVGQKWSGYLYGTTAETLYVPTNYRHQKYGAQIVTELAEGGGANTTVTVKWRPLQDIRDRAQPAGSPFIPVAWITGAGTGAWATSKTITQTSADSSGYGRLFYTYDPDTLIGGGEEGLNPPACDGLEFILTASDTMYVPDFTVGAKSQ